MYLCDDRRLLLLAAAACVACAVYEPAAQLPGPFATESSSGAGAGTGGEAEADRTGPSSAGRAGSPASPPATGGSPTVAAGSGGQAGTTTSSAGAGGQLGCGGGGLECADECLTDPNKLGPGVCGCGVVDADTALVASCVGLKAALVHRYDFEGSGTVVQDRVGAAHGSVKGGAELSRQDGRGVLTLSGGVNGPFVDLPNHLLSVLTDATLEAWLSWGGGNAWQRVFDFGDSNAASPEDTPLNGKTYLFLTAMSDAGSGALLRTAFSLNGGAAAAETRLDGGQALPVQTLAHLAVVVSASAGKLALYVDGQAVGEQNFGGALAAINDVNVWLGRAQYAADPTLTGTYHEFRIYKSALSAQQMATSFAAGPDPTFLTE